MFLGIRFHAKGFVLAIAGLGVRDIMGYCVTTLLFSGVVFVDGMYLF